MLCVIMHRSMTTSRNRTCTSGQSAVTIGLFVGYCFLHSSQAAAFLHQTHHSQSSIMALSQSPEPREPSNNLRVLGLHGSEGTGQDFASKLDLLYQTASSIGSSPPLQPWDILTLDAPFAKGSGYAWWLNPPGVRSYNAAEYPGANESIQRVTEALSQQEFESSGCVDLIIAHSQGAILTAALLALQKIPTHPRVGYILNGGAWPNPYAEALEEAAFLSDADSAVRALIITGQADRINPPDTQARVAEALQRAGAHVTTVTHAGGHSVPVENVAVVQQIVAWLQQADGGNSNVATNNASSSASRK